MQDAAANVSGLWEHTGAGGHAVGAAALAGTLPAGEDGVIAAGAAVGVVVGDVAARPLEVTAAHERRCRLGWRGRRCGGGLGRRRGRRGVVKGAEVVLDDELARARLGACSRQTLATRNAGDRYCAAQLPQHRPEESCWPQ